MRTGRSQTRSRASPREATISTLNGQGASKPATTTRNAALATSTRRPSAERASTRIQSPANAYQPTHLVAAAKPMRTPTSGSAHQALRAHRPDQICQKTTYAATMKVAT